MSGTNIGERIKLFRKELNLKQKDVAEAIGVKEPTITAWECAYRPPSDRAIRDICREFRVDEEWLRTGVGNMFQPETRNSEIAHFFEDVAINDDTFKSRFVYALTELSEADWERLANLADILAKK